MHGGDKNVKVFLKTLTLFYYVLDHKNSYLKFQLPIGRLLTLGKSSSMVLL